MDTAPGWRAALTMMGLGSGAGAAGLAALHGGVAGAAEASLLPPRGNIATVQLEGAPSMPATSHLCRLRDAVPFRQRAAPAARRPEARLSASDARDGHDVVVHHRGADDYAADSARGRLQGRHLEPKAVVPRGLRHLADPRLPLHALRRQRLARRGAIDGWCGCGHLRSAHAARASGPHARHGPLQRGSRGGCDRPRHRRFGERSCCRRSRHDIAPGRWTRRHQQHAEER